MNQLSIRDPELYPEELQSALNQLTINETPNVVGSTAYINHKYPSDVDVYEVVTVGMNRDDAVEFYVSQFKNIMGKIMIDAKLFYADLKIGIDPRFDVDMKKTDIIGRKKIAYDYLKEGIIDESTFLKLYKNAKNESDFSGILRSYRVLRWTPSEVIEGKKILPGNKYIDLSVAIQQDSLIKLDVITWIISRYVSVEIFFNLQYKDAGTGQVFAFHQIPSYIETILRDIEIYSSKKNYNPLKASKRLWSLSRITNCSDLLKEINPLLSSNAAALNQVVGDIESINIMLDQKKGNNIRVKDIDKIFLEILGFQKRIANHDFDVKFIDSKISEIYDIYQQWESSGKPLYECEDNKCYCLNIQDMLNNINVISSILSVEIVNRTDKFFKQLGEKNITCQNPRFITI